MKNDSQTHQTEAIRSDIDTTRRRMDETMDALGERLQPRHLLDEVLGWFRGETDNGDTRMSEMREKITSGASRAASSVVDTIKANPMPALLIGAGVAWMIYQSRRDHSSRFETEDYSSEIEYDPDLHYDRPMDYPSGYSYGDGDSKLDHLKDKASDVASSVKEKASDMADTVKEKAAQLGQRTKEKLSNVKDRAGEKLQAAKERAAELGSQVKEKAGAAYSATRDRVAQTADERPLELGLVCLAAGVIAGLALPVPAPVDRRVGPAANRLRQRAKQAGSEMLEKGKRVARAATDAVKNEAQAQGLTPDRLRDSAKAVAQSAGNAATDTARREGLPMAGENAGAGGQTAGNAGNLSGSSDPASARPTG